MSLAGQTPDSSNTTEQDVTSEENHTSSSNGSIKDNGSESNYLGDAAGANSIFTLASLGVAGGGSMISAIDGGMDYDEDTDEDEDLAGEALETKSLLLKDRSACTAQELEMIRRERNRIHAKKTRLRKKKVLGQMESSILALEEEVAALRRAAAGGGLKSSQSSADLLNVSIESLTQLRSADVT